MTDKRAFFDLLQKSLGIRIISIDEKKRIKWSHSTSPEIIHTRVLTGASYSPWSNDSTFQNLLKRLKDFTLVDTYRLWELWVLSGQMQTVPGDALEVGVWRGGSGALIARRLAHTEKKIFLADTFQGVVGAGINDSKYVGGEHSDVSISQVKRLMHDLKVENVVILQGIFPEETGHLVSGPLSFVHVDVDVYESAKRVMEFIAPFLSPGAIVVFDDYGFSGCEGVTKIVNELACNEKWTFIHNLNGHAILVVR